MAKTRTLKAEFFRSRSLAKCDALARLTFAGLWTEADDAGRGVADARIIAGAIWPLDDAVTHEDVERHLLELADTEHIHLYVTDGERYYHVLKWEKHQSASYRRSEPVHPAPPCNDLHTSAHIGVQDAPIGMSKGKGREGNIREGEGESAAPVVPLFAARSLLEVYVAAKPHRRTLTGRKLDDALLAIQGLIDAKYPDVVLDAIMRETPSLSDAALSIAIERALKDHPPAAAPVRDLRRENPCPLCEGHGHIYGDDSSNVAHECPNCLGTGINRTAALA